MAPRTHSRVWKQGKAIMKAGDILFCDGKPTDEVILVMGSPGSGKSTFVNSLFSESLSEVRVDPEKSCTSSILHIVRPHPMDIARRLVVVDMPSIGGNTQIDDEEILRRISVWLATSYTSDMKIAGILYLQDINKSGLDMPSSNNFQVFCKLCGADAFPSVVLGATKWSDEATSEDQIQRWKATQWLEAIRDGAHVFLLENTSESAWAKVNFLLSKRKSRGDCRLQIQAELVDRQKLIRDTAVGQELRSLQVQHPLRSMHVLDRPQPITISQRVKQLFGTQRRAIHINSEPVTLGDRSQVGHRIQYSQLTNAPVVTNPGATERQSFDREGDCVFDTDGMRAFDNQADGGSDSCVGEIAPNPFNQGDEVDLPGNVPKVDIVTSLERQTAGSKETIVEVHQWSVTQLTKTVTVMEDAPMAIDTDRALDERGEVGLSRCVSNIEFIKAVDYQAVSSKGNSVEVDSFSELEITFQQIPSTPKRANNQSPTECIAENALTDFAVVLENNIADNSEESSVPAEVIQAPQLCFSSSAPHPVSFIPAEDGHCHLRNLGSTTSNEVLGTNITLAEYTSVDNSYGEPDNIAQFITLARYNADAPAKMPTAVETADAITDSDVKMRDVGHAGDHGTDAVLLDVTDHQLSVDLTVDAQPAINSECSDSSQVNDSGHDTTPIFAQRNSIIIERPQVSTETRSIAVNIESAETENLSQPPALHNAYSPSEILTNNETVDVSLKLNQCNHEEREAREAGVNSTETVLYDIVDRGLIGDIAVNVRPPPNSECLYDFQINDSDHKTASSFGAQRNSIIIESTSTLKTTCNSDIPGVAQEIHESHRMSATIETHGQRSHLFDDAHHFGIDGAVMADGDNSTVNYNHVSDKHTHYHLHAGDSYLAGRSNKKSGHQTRHRALSYQATIGRKRSKREVPSRNTGVA